MPQQNIQEIRINGQIYTPDQLHLMDGEYSDLRLFLEAWWSPQPQMEVQTSGSTGQPKKMLVSKAAMLDSAIRTLRFFDLQAGQRALLCLPLHYIAGKMMVVRALAGQLNLVLRTPSGLPWATWKSGWILPPFRLCRCSTNWNTTLHVCICSTKCSLVAAKSMKSSVACSSASPSLPTRVTA